MILSEVKMSEEVTEAKKEFTIEIKISDKNLQYKSDFNEAETISWIESAKGLIIKNAFDNADIKQPE